VNLIKSLSRFFRQKSGDRLSYLEKSIGYVFHNRAFLEQSLSHTSYALSISNNKLLSNERMEFLGDAVLGFVMCDYVFRHYSDKGEGELSRMKSLIISRKALKEAADHIRLSDYLFLSRSEEKTGGRERFSINTNAFEAVIAAVYLDGGLKAAEKFIYRCVVPLLDSILENADFCNYKSQLLERVQKKGQEVPVYSVMSEKGPEHEKIFEISVGFWGKEQGSGSGKSKKEAEQSAARAALENLKTDDTFS